MAAQSQEARAQGGSRTRVARALKGEIDGEREDGREVMRCDDASEQSER